MENSSFQSAPASSLRKNGIGRLPDMVKNVERDGIGAGGDHHVHLGGDALLSEIENIGGFLTSPRDLFGAYISKRLAWTDCGAHRPLADGGPVVTHVAFHHLLALGKDFWDTERARQDTIRAADAARLREDCTIPSSPCLMASAGQTIAQGGSSQCQQTYAAEAIVRLRSMKSKLI